MIEIQVNSKDVGRVLRKSRRFRRKHKQEIEQLTLSIARTFRATVIRKASGRPGPNIVTGDYVSRFRIVESREGGEYTASVVNDHPAGPRLELGYVGRDSLGRNYSQPPYPHWRPAAEEVGPQFSRRGRDSIRKWWNNAD